MKTQRIRLLLGLGVFYCLAVSAIASTQSPVQSTLRPLGLSVTAPVQVAGSDSTAQAYATHQTTYLNYVNNMLPEGQVFTGEGLYQLDPQKLYFFFQYTPRVYFLQEGACYLDALGATIATVQQPTSSILTGNTFTIFPLAKSSISDVCATGSGKRTTSEPLLIGDFVQLPTVNAGQQLAFFLMANMSSGGTPAHTYYNGSSNNADNFQHMVAFFPDNSQYIVIGFEDMYGGGDKDCNDVLFVVDIGPNNAALLRNPSSLPK